MALIPIKYMGVTYDYNFALSAEHIFYGPKHTDIDSSEAIQGNQSVFWDEDSELFAPDWRNKYHKTYQYNKWYYPQDWVSNNKYIAIANTKTQSYPYPTTAQDTHMLIALDHPYTRGAYAGVIKTVNETTFLAAGEIKEFYVYIYNLDVDTTYKAAVTIKNTDGDVVNKVIVHIDPTLITQKGWNKVSISPMLVGYMDKVIVALTIGQGVAGSDTTFNAVWNYIGTTQTGYEVTGSVIVHADLANEGIVITGEDINDNPQTDLNSLRVGDQIRLEYDGNGPEDTYTLYMLTALPELVADIPGAYRYKVVVIDNVGGYDSFIPDNPLKITFTLIGGYETIEYGYSASVIPDNLYPFGVIINRVYLDGELITTTQGVGYGITFAFSEIFSSSDWDLVLINSAGEESGIEGPAGPAGIDGAAGVAGDSIYTATVYRRYPSVPASIPANEGSFDFNTNILTPPANWSSAPLTGNDPEYVCIGTFRVTGASGIDSTVSWTSPQLHVKDGAKGSVGLTGATGPAGTVGPKGADGSGVVIRGTDTITNILALGGMVDGDMWIATNDELGAAVPGVAGDGYVYVGGVWTNVGPIRGPEGAQGTQGDAGLGGLDGVDGRGWTGGYYNTPTGKVVFTSDDGLEFETGSLIGPAGVDGSHNIVATVYRRDSIVPDTPVENAGQYNFNTNVLVPPGPGTLPPNEKQWFRTPPAGTAPLYVSIGVFASDTSVADDVLWGDPALLVQNGEGIPTGGTAQQVLIKNSPVDYDASWGNYVIGRWDPITPEVAGLFHGDIVTSAPTNVDGTAPGHIWYVVDA